MLHWDDETLVITCTVLGIPSVEINASELPAKSSSCVFTATCSKSLLSSGKEHNYNLIDYQCHSESKLTV